MCCYVCSQIAEAAELAKYEEVRRRALEQKAVQTQQLEELKVGVGAREQNWRACSVCSVSLAWTHDEVAGCLFPLTHAAFPSLSRPLAGPNP